MHGGWVLRKLHLEDLGASFWKVVHEGDVDETRERGRGTRRSEKGGEGERMWEVKKKQRRRRKVVLRKVFMLVVEREGIGIGLIEFEGKR